MQQDIVDFELKGAKYGRKLEPKANNPLSLKTVAHTKDGAVIKVDEYNKAHAEWVFSKRAEQGVSVLKK